ncbi:hypothetical protein DY000_02052296 [Brassica cretica]|uniref:Uncharacterized protein n=1 Tax=Brassica cretica TaxID=69181 RepID=A0ABQ7A6L9_BRACR|nr:hypothetical protein DY000_02052296 [Brassica cretica]
MIVTLVLQRDENRDMHDPGGHLCNAAVSLVEQAIYPDEDQCNIDEMEFMLEKLLKDQQEMTEDFNLHLVFLCKELNGRLETLDTRVRMLYTQASQIEEAMKKQKALFQRKSIVQPTLIDTVHHVFKTLFHLR